jgi:hypothetical protein
MNSRESLYRAWKDDPCNLCEEESTRGVYSIRRVELSGTEKQSTHSVECQAERGQAMTGKGWEQTSVLSSYVSYVEVNGETRA